MIKLSIKSPDKNIFQDHINQIEEIIITTESGIIGIKDNHENLISAVSNGEIKVIFKNDQNVKDLIFAISDGILKIENQYDNNNIITNVNILLQEAENIDSINIQEIEKAIQRAKVSSESADKEEEIFINEQLLRNLNKIKVAKKYRL